MVDFLHEQLHRFDDTYRLFITSSRTSPRRDQMTPLAQEEHLEAKPFPYWPV